ncbi:MAG: glycosyltransferase family 4 protein [Anaerolineae bacterium]|nr:glycosyltransferase family 4 protein [Anaerolineae bacterium]
MHILLITGPFPRPTFIFRMALALAERGHRVTVAARNRGDWSRFRDALPLPPGLSVRYLLPESGLSDPRRLLRLLSGLLRYVPRSPVRAWRLFRGCASWREFVRYLPFLSFPSPDVIQFEFLVTATLYPKLGDLIGVPTVVSCRGADLHMLEQRPPEKKAARIDALRWATAVHCVADELAGEVNRLVGRTDRVFVNRPAVAAEAITPKDNYGAAIPKIISVGRLEWKKGYDYLLAALARLKRSGVAFQAEIVGGGALFAELRFSIDDLDLASEVQLVGRIAPSEVLDRLRRADLFVLSSYEEGIANAALEAMAAGLLVVTTAAGGMAEAIRDGVDGYVVPVRDIPALADRIERLLIDPALRERMGRSARQRCLDAFTLDRQVEQFELIYRQAVEANQ